MRKKIKALPIILVILLILASCGFIFESRNNIEKDMIPEHKVGNVYSYSNVNGSEIDTFEVIDISHFYDSQEDVDREEFIIALNRRTNSKFQIIGVNPHYVFIEFNADYIVIYPDDSIQNVQIKDIWYNDVFTYENDTANGNSDTLITKLYYQGNIGILGYEYENGDEYLLDTIIKAE